MNKMPDGAMTAEAVDSMKKKELQAKLKELGLDTKGKEKEMRERLKDHVISILWPDVTNLAAPDGPPAAAPAAPADAPESAAALSPTVSGMKRKPGSANDLRSTDKQQSEDGASGLSEAMVKTMSKKEVVAKLLAVGLPTTGKESLLRERLKAHSLTAKAEQMLNTTSAELDNSDDSGEDDRDSFLQEQEPEPAPGLDGQPSNALEGGRQRNLSSDLLKNSSMLLSSDLLPTHRPVSDDPGDADDSDDDSDDGAGLCPADSGPGGDPLNLLISELKESSFSNTEDHAKLVSLLEVVVASHREQTTFQATVRNAWESLNANPVVAAATERIQMLSPPALRVSHSRMQILTAKGTGRLVCGDEDGRSVTLTLFSEEKGEVAMQHQTLLGPIKPARMGSGLSLLVLSRSDLQHVVFCETYDLKHAKNGAMSRRRDWHSAALPLSL